MKITAAVILLILGSSALAKLESFKSVLNGEEALTQAHLE